MGLIAAVRSAAGRFRTPSSRIIALLGIYTAVVVPLVTFLNLFSDDPHARAKVLMGFLLVLIWCLGFGLVSFYGRDRYRRWVGRLRLAWPIPFILGAVAGPKGE